MGERPNSPKEKTEALIVNMTNENEKSEAETSSTQKQSNKQFLKVVSLVTLTIQNASLTLFMRAARTQKDVFLTSSAVIMSELLKLITCFFMVYRDEGKCRNVAFVCLHRKILCLS